MWRFLQSCIIGAVMAANIYWKWTPNPYAAGFLGALCAFLVTWIVSKAYDLLIVRPRKRQNAAFEHGGRNGHLAQRSGDLVR